MPWTCHICTFHHDQPNMEHFLSCQMCNTARQSSQQHDDEGEVSLKYHLCLDDDKDDSKEDARKMPAITTKGAVIDLTSTTTTTASKSDTYNNDGNYKHDDDNIETITATATPSNIPFASTTPQPSKQQQQQQQRQYPKLSPPPTPETQSPTMHTLSTFLSSSSENNNNHHVYMISPLDANSHTYFQKDNWSCGYRNLQSLLSFLLHLPCSNDDDTCVDYKSALLQGNLAIQNTNTTTTVVISSIPTIQHCIKQAWDAGYDPTTIPSELQHRRTFPSQKNKWIGTPEVVALLRYIGIPIDIRAWSNDTREDDRNEWPVGATCATDCLISFLVHYFCSGGNGVIARQELTKEEWEVQDYGKKPKLEERHDCSPSGSSHNIIIKPPVYLQRRGHSMTCVGVVLDENTPQPLFSSTKTIYKNAALLLSDPAIQNGRVRKVFFQQLSRFTAWEVGFLSRVNQLLSLEEGKRIECATFQNML